MRICANPPTARQGSVLVLALVVLAIMGLALASSITHVQTQLAISARSQQWNAGIGLAEAGVEEALAHLQFNASNLVSQGWTGSASSCVLQRTFGSDFFLANITTNVSAGPRFTNVVTSSGCIYMPSSASFICRTVQVQVVRTIGTTSYAIVARNQVTMKGNPAGIDSFDSRDPAKSTGGCYDAAKRQANANVGCVSGAFSMGNGDVWGKIVQGSGAMGISTGPNCVVGDLSWHSSGKKGIQPGAALVDSTLAVPDVAEPFSSASVPPALTIGTTNYAAVLDTGNYLISSNFAGKVLVRGNAVLYVKGDVTITGASFLQMLSGAMLKLYVGGTDVNIQDVRMNPGSGTVLGVFGLPSVNNVDVATGPGAPVFINAPSADFSLGGNRQFYGGVICKTYSCNGTPAFHFDEALGAILSSASTFNITSWAEK